MAVFAHYPIEDGWRNIVMSLARTDENGVESFAVLSKITQLRRNAANLRKGQDGAQQPADQDEANHGDAGITKPATAGRRAVHPRSGTIC